MAVVRLPHAIQTDNVPVIEAGQYPRLPLKPLPKIMAKPELEREQL
jgi:hypothetical protein